MVTRRRSRYLKALSAAGHGKNFPNIERDQEVCIGVLASGGCVEWIDGEFMIHVDVTNPTDVVDEEWDTAEEPLEDDDVTETYVDDI